MKQTLFVTLLLLMFGSNLYAQSEGTPVRSITGSGVPGGGVAHTVGTEYLDISQSPPVPYVCASISVATGPNPPAGTITCNWTTMGGGGTSLLNANLIDGTASKYGLVSGIMPSDVTTTATSNNVSCPNNDCNFTAAQNGFSCFVTNVTSDLSSITGAEILPGTANTVGTWTTTGAQTGTCVGTGAATQSVVGAATLVLAPKMATALNSMFADTVAVCGHLQLPPGVFLWEAPIFNTGNSPRCLEQGTNTSYSVSGWSDTETILVPSPDLSPAACTGATNGGNLACSFAASGLNFHNIEVYGAGIGSIGAGFNGKVGVSLSATGGANSTAYQFNVLGWGGGTAGFIGFQVFGQSQVWVHQGFIDGAGIVNCQVASAYTTFSQMVCGNSNNNALMINGVGEFWDFGSNYGQMGGASTQFGAVVCRGGIQCYFIGSNIPYTTGTTASACAFKAIDAGTVAWLIGVNIGNPSAAANACGIGINNTAAVIYMRDSQILVNTGSAIGISLIGPAGTVYLQGGNIVYGNLAFSNGGTIYDEGFEKFTTVAANVNTGTIQGPNVWQGSCTGVASASTTIGLYGMGEVATTTCTTANADLTYVIADRAGTIMGMTATATANSVTGTVTLRKISNGAAGNTSMTCSLTGAQRCTDFAVAHQVTYVAGDMFTVSYVGGVGETGANIHVGLYRQ